MKNIQIKLKVLISAKNLMLDEKVYSTDERKKKIANAVIVMNDIIKDYSKEESLTG